MSGRLSLHDRAVAAANRSLVISGPARSGTTLIGAVIHSCERVEYVMEPPMLFALLPLVERLGEADFALLFETYVYEEMLMGHVTGRAFNFNDNDLSCVRRAKGEGDIARRMATAWRKETAAEAARDRIMAFKLPDITPFMAPLLERYPGMQGLVMARNANAVMNSVAKKNWLDDESLSRRYLMWPTDATVTPPLPFWAGEELRDRWSGMGELERAGEYYLRVMEGIEKLPRTLVVSYDALLASPAAVTGKMIGALGMTPGEKTADLIDTIRESPGERDDLVSQLPDGLRQRVGAISDRYTGFVGWADGAPLD
ncbi:MAG: hypothetical protein HQK87_06485 [Nitrospinae bacterium]|nr:hypothetical protein [Nitrospinota bacterium]